jgi:class 3 adenylate cyclase
VLLCPNCGEENSDRARFCQACGTPLVPERAPVEERKVVSVLFVDLVGFTARSELLDPEDVRSILARYYERLRVEIERFGGTVEKFVGDAVMGVFGAPVAHGDDAERAVRAALAAKAALADMNAADPSLDLAARIAVNTGEAIVAVGARAALGEAMVAGDVVNTASRLQSAAPTNGVLVGEETYAATRGVIEYQPVDPVEAKGKRAPVAAWLALRAMAPAGERSFAPGPLVGRGAELAVLRGMWERVADERRLHLVTVFGPTGIGKSRLAFELGGRAAASGGRVLRGRSLPYGESGPYGAFAQQVKQLAGIFDNDPLTVAHDRLGELVRAHAPQDGGEETAAHLGMLLGLRTEGSVSDRETLFFSARVLLESLAAKQPTLVVFEDLHWADPSLLDLVEFLSGRIRDVPLMILTLTRPELLSKRPTWAGGLPAYSALHLEPLAARDALELTARLLDQHGLAVPQTQASSLAETAEGNPLFIEELAASFVEHVSAGPGAMPTTIREILSARIDALPAAERSVILDAAVAGKVFWRGVLARLQPDREQELGQVLGSLEQRDLIRREAVSRIQGEQQFVFKHVLIRDVAYQTLPRPERRHRHATVARFLEEATPDLGDAAGALAHHWREAGESARAVRYLLSAGEQAGRGWAKQEAVDLYQQALDLVPEDAPDLRREVLRHLAVASMQVWHAFDARRLQARGGEEASPGPP